MNHAFIVGIECDDRENGHGEQSRPHSRRAPTLDGFDPEERVSVELYAGMWPQPFS
jgi:hypothetical protein